MGCFFDVDSSLDRLRTYGVSSLDRLRISLWDLVTGPAKDLIMGSLHWTGWTGLKERKRTSVNIHCVVGVWSLLPMQ